MQNRQIDKPQLDVLANFFIQQDPYMLLTYAASVVAVPVAAFSTAAATAANHPLISHAALTIALLQLADPVMAEMFEMPSPGMYAAAAVHSAGSKIYHTFFGAKTAPAKTPVDLTKIGSTLVSAYTLGKLI